MLRDLYTLSPLLVTGFTALLVLGIDVFSKRVKGDSSHHLGWITALGNLAALGLVVKKWWWGSVALKSPFLAGMLSPDLYTLFFWGGISLFIALVSLSSIGYDRDNQLHHGEYYGLLTLAGLGMMLMVSATDLMVFFLALETMSLAIYALVAIRRFSALGAEAAIKYFLTGGLASAFFLMGLALVWGETGSTNYYVLAPLFIQGATPIAYVGILMILAGFSFKVALVPFHMWTPDAYQGAAAPVTGFMASGVKVAAFAAMLRFFFLTSADDAGQMFIAAPRTIILWLSIATLVIGSLLALHQKNVKRILAYSSIVHAGYLGLGFLVGPTLSPAMPFYLLAYGIANIGAFSVLSMLENSDPASTDLDSFKGLATRNPFAALVLTISLLSLAGFPPTVGFAGKFYLFRDLIVSSSGALTWAVVVAVSASLVSIYYYLSPVVSMYMKEGGLEIPASRTTSGLKVALTAVLVAILLAGVLPSALFHRSTRAAASLPVISNQAGQPQQGTTNMSRFLSNK